MTRRRGAWFLSDRAGLAGIEFALIAPVMVTLLLSAIELTNVFRVQAKLSTAAGQLAEMVAGQRSVTAPGGTLADLCTGAAFNLLPFNAGPFAADIASVSNDHPSNRVNGSTDSTSVATYLDWESTSPCPSPAPGSMGLGGATALANSPMSLLTSSGSPPTSASDLAQGASAIVVSVTYVYPNVAPFLLGASITFTATAAARPRLNATIGCTTPSGTTRC